MSKPASSYAETPHGAIVGLNRMVYRNVLYFWCSPVLATGFPGGWIRESHQDKEVIARYKASAKKEKKP